MKLTIEVHHFIHTADSEQLNRIESKLDQTISDGQTLSKLAADLKAGNDAVENAIKKNEGNIA